MTQAKNVQNLNKIIFDGFCSRILHVIARALSQTKLFSFDIEYLQSENPSYRERADLLLSVHEDMQKVSQALGFDYQSDVIGEYIALMQRMAKAIEDGDQNALEESMCELDKKPFIY